MDPKVRLAELQQAKSERGLTIAEWYEVATLLRVLGQGEQAAEAERRAQQLIARQMPPERQAPTPDGGAQTPPARVTDPPRRGAPTAGEGITATILGFAFGIVLGFAGFMVGMLLGPIGAVVGGLVGLGVGFQTAAMMVATWGAVGTARIVTAAFAIILALATLSTLSGGGSREQQGTDPPPTDLPAQYKVDQSVQSMPGPRASVVEATEWLSDWERAHGSKYVVGAVVDNDDENQVMLSVWYNPPTTVEEAKAAGRQVRKEFSDHFPRYHQPIRVTIRRIVDGRPEPAFDLTD